MVLGQLDYPRGMAVWLILVELLMQVSSVQAVQIRIVKTHLSQSCLGQLDSVSPDGIDVVD